MDRPRFHLAFPVRSLAEARAFYGGLLGCPEGRSAEDWVDFDLHGPPDRRPPGAGRMRPRHDLRHQPSRRRGVPVRHFGLILAPDAWRALADRLTRGRRATSSSSRRPASPASPGEQSTLFVRDPSGNALEFKAFADEAMIFAT